MLAETVAQTDGQTLLSFIYRFPDLSLDPAFSDYLVFMGTLTTDDGNNDGMPMMSCQWSSDSSYMFFFSFRAVDK